MKKTQIKRLKGSLFLGASSASFAALVGEGVDFFSLLTVLIFTSSAALAYPGLYILDKIGKMINYPR